MPEVNIVVKYEEIVKAIGEQINAVLQQLKVINNQGLREEMNGISKIEISDEQSYNKKRKESQLFDTTVYIVVKFGSGSVVHGSSVIPISLLCMGVANKVKPLQLLLSIFASTWNTKNLCQGSSLEISDALQVWNTPEVVSNFNEAYTDFVNLYRLSGHIVIGSSAVRVGTLTYFYGEGADDHEEINIMSFQDGYHASLDSQPFGNTNGFSKSEVNFSTYTFSFSMYLLNNHLSVAALSLRGFRNRTTSGIGALFEKDSSNNIVQKDNYFFVEKNDELRLKIDFTNGFTNFPADNEIANLNDPVLASDFYEYYKVVDSRIGQELAGLPTLTLTLTR